MSEIIIQALNKVVPRRVYRSKLFPYVVFSILIVAIIMALSTIGDDERWIHL